MRLVFNDVGVSCVCTASASHIFANRVPQRDRRWADAIWRRHQQSPVPAVPMLALTPTTLKILFHRDRASTTWAYLLVLHGMALLWTERHQGVICAHIRAHMPNASRIRQSSCTQELCYRQ